MRNGRLALDQPLVIDMTFKVAIVKIEGNAESSLKRALDLIGGIGDLDLKNRDVVIKLGVFDHKGKNHTSTGVVRAIIGSFRAVPHVFLTESNNYKGTGSQRLRLWRELFSERVTPFNLTEDKETSDIQVTDERIPFSHILFKPNVFVSTHVLRKYENGTILKNLLGLVPDAKKVRFHKKLPKALMDMYEAIGGIDLAVIDGTFAYAGASSSKRKKADILVVGRNAVAVEAVGARLVGLDPLKMPVIVEATKRGLGEGDPSKIEVLGASIKDIEALLKKRATSTKRKKRS
jgi:uncharacterized protein (DUF362 family)